jgi:hypothetical protein
VVALERSMTVSWVMLRAPSVPFAPGTTMAALVVVEASRERVAERRRRFMERMVRVLYPDRVET